MVTCLEVLSTDSTALAKIAAELSVHPLALEDCQHRDQRAKLDDYESQQLLVWFMLAKDEIYELQFLIFPDALVMVPHQATPTGQTWTEFLKLTPNHRDVWHALYQALDRATDITWQELRNITKAVDEFEEDIFLKDLHPQDLIALKRHLNEIDFSIGHLTSVSEQIINLSQPSGDLAWKLRDLHDHCHRIDRTISLYRAQIATTIDLYWGLQANRTNGQIKKLSLLASISVPLTFWSSFWGMNFQIIPFHQPSLLAVAIAVMILSAVLTMWFLVRKGYWNS